MKLLVIDDHPIVRQGVAALLEQTYGGVAVLQARDVAEGQAATGANPDLDAILLDLRFPGETGTSAVRAFASRCPGVPIVILSSSEDPADVRAAIADGAAGYVPKSASAQTLVAALTLVLAGSFYLPPFMLDAAPERRPGPLTGRQAEVLAAICEGHSNRDIGTRLDLSEKTVKAHVTAIFRSLDVVSRTQAVNAARAAGLVP